MSFEENGTGDAGSIASMLLDQPAEFLNWWADPEHEYINSLLGQQIHAAIDQLPEIFRMTILLINVEGLSYDETAVVLGIPRGTVRSRMKRGRTMLQKALWMQAREGLDITTLICSNRSYNILNIEFSRSGITSPGRFAQALTDLSHPAIDWVQISKGMGVPAVAVDSCEALAKELKKALDEPGAHLIEMLLNKNRV